MKTITKTIPALLALAALAAGCATATADTTSGGASDDSAQITSLATEGENLAQELSDETTAGADDPIWGCTQVDRWDRKADRLSDIVSELEGLEGVDQDLIDELWTEVDNMAEGIAGARGACAAMGL
jgi:hypothetical protein